MDRYERYLSYFTDRYEIRFCRLDEVDKLVDFIHRYWKADHALVRSRKLLNWQHLDEANGRYNFAVACHKETGEFHALEGFIPSSQFDPEIKDENTMLWGALWKAREDVNEPGLGILVDMYFVRSVSHMLSMGVGLSGQSIANQNSRHYAVDTLEQFFLLNQSMTEYKLCEPNGLGLGLTFPQPRDELVELSEEDYGALEGSCFLKLVPYKSRGYYIGRYFHHPIYTYRFFALRHRQDTTAILVIRACEHEEARCLRIVDYIGDGTELAGNGALLQGLLEREKAEYIDFLSHGFSHEGLERCGFRNSIGTDAVIPNYYEPFVKCACRVVFNIPPEAPDALRFVVKGDADQDRPNLIL